MAQGDISIRCSKCGKLVRGKAGTSWNSRWWAESTQAVTETHPGLGKSVCPGSGKPGKGR